MPGFITDENGNLIEFTGAKIKSELLSYDLIIRTQNDFDDFCNSVTNGTCTARSVLFVGDGGTFEFVKADGLAIDLLSTNIKKISGIKNAIINIQAEGKTSIYGLRANADVDNITLKITGARIIIGFTNFTSATNLTFIGQTADNGPCIGFQQCNNIANCYADCTSPQGYARGYKNCTNIVNSKGVISTPLSKNNIGSMSSVFSDSTNLSNVEAIINEDTPNAYGFFDCENISNYICTHGDTYLGDTLDCTNVSALTDGSNLTEENVASWQDKLREEKYTLNEVTSSTTEISTTSSTTLISKSIDVKANRNYLIFFSAPIHCANYGGGGLDLIIDDSTIQSVVNTSTAALNMNVFYIYKPTTNATINLKVNLRAYSGDTAKLRGYQSRVLTIMEV